MTVDRVTTPTSSQLSKPALTVIKGGVDLSTPLRALPRVGEDKEKKLAKLELHTVGDLLMYLPRRYEDTTNITSLTEICPGQIATAVARVVRTSSRYAKNLLLVDGVLEADGVQVNAIWFNQGYLERTLKPGSEWIFSGKVERDRLGKLSFRNPKVERWHGHQIHVGNRAPIYPETSGLTSKYLRSIIEPILPMAALVTDVLPPEIRRDEDLMDVGEAVTAIHRPTDEETGNRGKERLAFEELFLLQLAAERARRRRLAANGIVIPYDVEVARAFANSLPFKLTDGQRVAAHEILTDLADSGPMNRLLQGDVGSGKTAVAAMAANLAHHAGYQTAYLAPTEILARQHHKTLSALLEPHGVHVRLLVGATSGKARAEITEGTAAGHDPVVVGTHALLEEDVTFANLGLAVVDEQHRFGVAQRQRLRRKSDVMVNFLAMTATPIPRTLALTLYGDVNVSEIREMPPGRMPITTKVVAPHERDEAYRFIRAQVSAGRQAFVICPLIEESDKLGARSVTAEYERLRDEVFPDLRIEYLHGRMPAKEKEERMSRFAAGEADVLVSTSVVEVGVDVPNASVMLIESAERFGLAQLHQFRGRVGRGRHQSYCLLFVSGNDEEATLGIKAMAQTNSGFELAEIDMRIRGAGDVAGLRQHGLPDMRAANLLDFALVQRAKAAAQRWLDRDPDITEYEPLSRAMNDYRAVFDLD